MAESLKSFTVDISYDVDEGSIKRAEQGFDATAVSIAEVQKTVAAVTRNLQDFVKQLQAVSGKPAQDIKNTGQQIKNTWELLAKGAKEWGATAALTTGAFLKQMENIAKSYTDLYYLSARTGASVQGLKALQGASKALGGDANEAVSAVANLTHQFQVAPGTEANFRRLTQEYMGQVQKNTGLTQEQFDKLDQSTKDYLAGLEYLADPKIPQAVREAWAKNWYNYNAEQMAKHTQMRGEEGRLIGENIATLEKFGLTQEDTQRTSKEALKLQEDWNNLSTHFGWIWDQAFKAILPLLEKVIKGIDWVVVKIGEFNRSAPFASVIETFGVLFVSIKVVGSMVGWLISMFGGAGAAAAGVGEAAAGLGAAGAATGGVGVLGSALGGVVGVATTLTSILSGIGVILLGWQAFKFGEELGKQIETLINKSETGRKALENVRKTFWGLWGHVASGEEKRKAMLAGEAVPAAAPDAAPAAGASAVTAPAATAAIPPATTLGLFDLPTKPGQKDRPGMQEGGIVQANLHQGEMVLPKNISTGIQKLFARGGQAEVTEKTMNRVAGLAMSVAQKLAPVAMGPVFGQANATLKLIQILEKGIAEMREDPKGLANPERGQALWDKLTGGSKVGEFPGVLPGVSGGDQKDAKDADRRLSNWLTGVGGVPKVVFENVEEFAEQFVQALLAKTGQKPTGEGAGGGTAGSAGGGAGAGAGAPGAAGGAPTTPGGQAGAAAGGAVGEALSKLRGGEGAGGGVMRDQRLDLLEKTIYELETSSGKDVTTSSAGARGHMQMMPDTFKEFAKPGEQIDNPEDNKRVARRYIEHLYDQFGGDMDKVLTAYNAGPGRVGRPVSELPQETQNYLTKAHKLWGGRVPTEPMTAGPVTPGYGPGAYGEKGAGKADASAAGGADPDLVAATTAGFNAVLPEGFTARVTSGKVPRKGGGFHPGGQALDWQIYDKEGKKVPNLGADTSGLYQQAYVHSMAHMMQINPAKAGEMGWGGHFGSDINTGGGPPDLMHYDLGKQRGRYSNEKEFAAERQQAAAIAKSMGGGKQTQVATAEPPMQAWPEGLGGHPSFPSAQMGGIIPNIMGGIMPLLAHAGEMVLPRELSQGLQRMISAGDAIGGMERMGALGLGGNVTNNRGGNNNVTFNQQNTTSIAASSPPVMASKFRDAHERIYGDLVRNFRAVLA